MRIGLALAALIFVFAAGTASSSSGSGLYGVVKRGPLTSVCTAEKACDGPASGALVLFSRNGHTVCVHAAKDGRYRVALVPGFYVVRTTDQAVGRGLSPARVHVRIGHVDRLDFSIDTGIR